MMLFPVYWMVNARSSRPQHADGGFLPLDPTFEGLPAGAQRQGAHLVTSVLIAVARVLCLLISGPARMRGRQFRSRWWGSGCWRSWFQMIPGIVIANALYRPTSGSGC